MGEQLGNEADRSRLRAYADGLDAQADALEPPAPVAAPVRERHQNPVQMQQSRVTPPAKDESEES